MFNVKWYKGLDIKSIFKFIQCYKREKLFIYIFKLKNTGNEKRDYLMERWGSKYSFIQENLLVIVTRKGHSCNLVRVKYLRKILFFVAAEEQVKHCLETPSLQPGKGITEISLKVSEIANPMVVSIYNCL